MTDVLVAPTHYTNWYKTVHSVFLAGAIDMGSAVNWQDQVTELVQGHSLVVFNPRRSEFTADTLDEQIKWELEHLDKATTVFMWFPKDAKAPVAMLETGLFLNSGRLIVGAEDGFYRRRNLELTCEYCKVPLYNTIGLCIAALLRRVYKVEGQPISD